jgi:hypothetical protein
MRKRLLPLLALLLTASATFAQNNLSFNAEKLDRSVIQKQQTTVLNLKKSATARKTTLADNQRILGLYTTDDVAGADQGIGFNSAQDLKMAIYLPSSLLAKYDGAKIVSIRFGLCASVGKSRVFVAPLTSDGNIGSDVVSQDVTSTAEGWNTVDLTTPYTIDLKTLSNGFLMGFDYTQVSGKYPLSYVKQGEIGPSYCYGNLGNGIAWYNVGAESYGNLSVQCIVESNNFPKKDIVLTGIAIDSKYKKAGEKLSYGFDISNFGTETINSYALNVTLDGKNIKTLTTPVAVTKDKNSVKDEITLPSDIADGEHNLAVFVDKIDGETPTQFTEDDTLAIPFNTYSASVARQMQLVEQFTSTYCTYCPGGSKALKNFAATRSDLALVAVHGNLSSGTDIYKIAANDSIMLYLNVGGYPSAAFNRCYIADAEEPGISQGIGFSSYATTDQINQYFQALLDESTAAPSFATVNVTANYEYASRKLNVNVSGEGVDKAAQILSGYGLYVYLTEDSLISKQLNNGTWISKYQHDHVVRALMTPCLGTQLIWNGNNYSNDLTTTLKSAWNPQKMNIVAFIAPIVNDIKNVDYTALAVNNCNMINLKDIYTTGIKDVNANDDNATEVARYNAAGQQINGAQKGINIIKMSNGKTVKVIVNK